jgi:tRNA threonylcarbamoyladenosine biosynthesis protein TsaB
VKVLGLDTALGACQAAVLDGDEVLAALAEPMQRGHQERLGPMVQVAVAQAGLSFADLDRIGVSVGPGSFTGVRVGLAFAKGLALALRIPLVGLGTLEALAASLDPAGVIAAVIDARRGQVYLQGFRDGGPLGEPQVLAMEQACEQLGRIKPGVIVGPGAGLFESLIEARIMPLEAPDVVALARLAARSAAPGETPRPIYLRAPDARPAA